MFFTFSRWQEDGLDRYTCHISGKPPRERKLLPNPAKRRCTLSVIPVENAAVGEDEDDERIKMQQEIDRLSKELERLQVEKFGLQRFAGSDSDI